MPRVRFGLFQFDPGTGELLRDGRQVRLQAQPAKALALLASARGELVTREALRYALWDDGTSVDFDRSLNFAIAQVRTALGDSAESPTFIRTVPKRGYRFLAPVSEQPDAVIPATEAALAPAPAVAAQSSRRWILAPLAAAAVSATTMAFVIFRQSAAHNPSIAVARFQNETGNPAFDRFADTVTDSVVAELTSQTRGRYGIIGNAAILRRRRSFLDLDELASTLKAQYVVIGQVQQDGPRVRLLAHLIRVPEKIHIEVSRLNVDSPASEPQLAAHIADDFARRLNSSNPANK